MKAVVIREDGYLPENESVRRNEVKQWLFLLLYHVFEGAYRLRGFDLDREETAGFISDDQTVEFEWERHETWSHVQLVVLYGSATREQGLPSPLET